MRAKLGIVITGGRSYADKTAVTTALEKVLRLRGQFTLIAGGCTGADSLAVDWAIARGIEYEIYPANWAIGRQAGPVRNRQMLMRVKSFDHYGVVAFPGGRGTANCIATARQLDIPVWQPFS